MNSESLDQNWSTAHPNAPLFGGQFKLYAQLFWGKMQIICIEIGGWQRGVWVYEGKTQAMNFGVTGKTLGRRLQGRKSRGQDFNANPPRSRVKYRMF